MEEHHAWSEPGLGRVLVAHDDAGEGARLRRLLEPFWLVDVVSSTRAEVRAVEALRADLIVAGVARPQVDGVELLRALRGDRATREVAVILLIPGPARGARVQGLAAGADHVLVEPYDADEVVVCVRALLQRAHRHHQRGERLAETNRELRRRVSELQALLDVLPVGIGIALDRQCRDIRINRAFATTLGLSSDDNASKTAPEPERPTNFRVLGPDGVEVADHDLPMQRVAREGIELREVELDIVHADGRVYRLLEYAAPLFDEQGEPRGAVGAFVDVTASRHTQRRDQLLVRLDDAMRALTEPAAIAREFVRLLAPEMGARAVTLNEVLDPQSIRTTTIARFLSGEPAAAETSASRTCNAEDLSTRLRGGQHVPALLNAAGTPSRGDPVFVAGAGVTIPVFRDEELVALLSLAPAEGRRVTASDIDLGQQAAVRCWNAIERARVTRSLRESEERYRRIFDTAGVSIWEEDFSQVKAEIDRLREDGLDPERYVDEHPEFVSRCLQLVRVVNVNDASVRMFGAPDKRALLESLGNIFESEPHSVFAGELRALIRGERRFEAETALRALDGRVVHAMVSVTFPEEDDAFRRVLVSLGDITARKAAETALQRLYEDLEQANRLKDDFLATLSHELRTPLNAVLGWAQMLRTGAMGPDVRTRALESLERNARAQAKIVEDLLDVSRIVSGKLQIKSDPVDLGAVVASAADTVRPAAAAKGVALGVTHEADVRLIVTGDEDRLQQVVWNLLSNAIKFTPQGGRVDVRVHQSAGRAEVVVADTGEGIAPSFQPHLFQRFRQWDSSTARRHGGLGLGLSIVRHLTEAHGGTVGAESRGPERGATFIVGLPMRTIESVGPQGALGPPVPAAGMHTLAGMRALVVDDDPDSRDLVKYVLESRGGDVVTAGSTAEALHAVSRGVFDIVVADIGMPEQDGYALMRGLSDAGLPAQGLSVVAVTAYASIAERDRALRAGFAAHLAKPVDPDRLIAIIQATVGHRRMPERL